LTGSRGIQKRCRGGGRGHKLCSEPRAVTVTKWTVGGFGDARPGAVRLPEWCVLQYSLIRAATVSVRRGGLRHNGASRAH